MRYYPVNGKLTPSVTTILGATAVDSPELAAWRARATPEDLAHAEEEKRIGGIRGNALHDVVEDYFENAVEPANDALAYPYFESVRSFFDRITVVRAIEVPIWHPVGYAGRVDMEALVDGHDAVVDWKTAKRPKPITWLRDYLLQVTAYAASLRMIYGWPILNAHVVIGLVDSKPQVVDLNEGMLLRLWPAWLDRVRQFHAQQPEPPEDAQIAEAIA